MQKISEERERRELFCLQRELFLLRFADKDQEPANGGHEQIGKETEERGRNSVRFGNLVGGEQNQCGTFTNTDAAYRNRQRGEHGYHRKYPQHFYPGKRCFHQRRESPCQNAAEENLSCAADKDDHNGGSGRFAGFKDNFQESIFEFFDNGDSIH